MFRDAIKRMHTHDRGLNPPLHNHPLSDFPSTTFKTIVNRTTDACDPLGYMWWKGSFWRDYADGTSGGVVTSRVLENEKMRWSVAAVGIKWWAAQIEPIFIPSEQRVPVGAPANHEARAAANGRGLASDSRFGDQPTPSLPWNLLPDPDKVKLFWGWRNWRQVKMSGMASLLDKLCPIMWLAVFLSLFSSTLPSGNLLHTKSHIDKALQDIPTFLVPPARAHNNTESGFVFSNPGDSVVYHDGNKLVTENPSQQVISCNKIKKYILNNRLHLCWKREHLLCLKKKDGVTRQRHVNCPNENTIFPVLWLILMFTIDNGVY